MKVKYFNCGGFQIHKINDSPISMRIYNNYGIPHTYVDDIDYCKINFNKEHYNNIKIIQVKKKHQLINIYKSSKTQDKFYIWLNGTHTKDSKFGIDLRINLRNFK